MAELERCFKDYHLQFFYLTNEGPDPWDGSIFWGFERIIDKSFETNSAFFPLYKSILEMEMLG